MIRELCREKHAKRDKLIALVNIDSREEKRVKNWRALKSDIWRCNDLIIVLSTRSIQKKRYYIFSNIIIFITIYYIIYRKYHSSNIILQDFSHKLIFFSSKRHSKFLLILNVSKLDALKLINKVELIVNPTCGFIISATTAHLAIPMSELLHSRAAAPRPKMTRPWSCRIALSPAAGRAFRRANHLVCSNTIIVAAARAQHAYAFTSTHQQRDETEGPTSANVGIINFARYPAAIPSFNFLCRCLTKNWRISLVSLPSSYIKWRIVLNSNRKFCIFLFSSKKICSILLRMFFIATMLHLF